jgi:hypothetical protein
VGDTGLGLRCFEAVSPEVLEQARILVERKGIQVEVDAHRTELLIDVTVAREGGLGQVGMAGADAVILDIMQDKLRGGELRA